MAIKRAKEEKLKLIVNYEASGLSTLECSNVNDISTSTFVVQ